MGEPAWIDVDDALDLHDQVLAFDGGSEGLRDQGLLESALARPKQHLAHNDGIGTIELAALYTAGVVQNHPFVDGNKRTGFLLGVLFLELNGVRFVADELEAVEAVVALASHAMDEAQYAAFLERHSMAAGPFRGIR